MIKLDKFSSDDEDYGCLRVQTVNLQRNKNITVRTGRGESTEVKIRLNARSKQTNFSAKSLTNTDMVVSGTINLNIIDYVLILYLYYSRAIFLIR